MKFCYFLIFFNFFCYRIYYFKYSEESKSQHFNLQKIVITRALARDKVGASQRDAFGEAGMLPQKPSNQYKEIASAVASQ